MRETGEAPAPSLTRRMRRAIGRIYRDLGPVEDACRDALRSLAFMTWRILVRFKLSRKAVLIMNCGEGGEIDGFYAQFTVILGLLEHFENFGDVIAGVRVDFENRGLYYDAAFGSNSWEYYFETVDIGRDSDAAKRKIDIGQQYRFAARGEHMPRAKAFELITRHIHVKPHIHKIVDTFVSEHFEDFYLIGIHYRGTDKWKEAPRVPYEDLLDAVRNAIGALQTDHYRLFVASDEQAFVDYLATSFPDKVLCWETHRSVDGSPIDFIMGNNYKKGEDVIIDCLLLSRCRFLIRTSSSLSLCSTYFNPELPVILLNQRH